MTEIKGDNIYSADIHLLDYMNAKGTYQVQATVIDEAGNKSTQVLPVEVAYEYNKQGTIKANDVNVRSSFSTESASLGKVHKGDTFKVLGEVDTMDSYGKWIAIDYNGKLGYVVATYVTVIDLGGTPPSEPAAPPAEAEGWVLIIKTNVNIRSGPDTCLLYTSNSRYGTCKYLGDVFFYKNRYRVDKNTVVDKLHVVNRVPMEQYLYGVSGYEIGSGSHIEALKAQAVAARGYAINQLAPGEPNYEVGDTSSYQVYHGYDGNARVIQAVDATRGQVVSYNGKVCNTFFGASNGGQTELPGNAFGGGSSKNAQYLSLIHI